MGKRSNLKKSKQKKHKGPKRSSPKRSSPKRSSPKSSSPKSSASKWKEIINYLTHKGIIENKGDHYKQNNITIDQVDDLKQEFTDFIISKFYYKQDSLHDTYVIWTNDDDNYLLLGTNHPFIFNEYGIIQCNENGVYKNRDFGRMICDLESEERRRKGETGKRLYKIENYFKYTDTDIVRRKLIELEMIKEYHKIEDFINKLDNDINRKLFMRPILKKQRFDKLDDVYKKSEKKIHELLNIYE